MNTHWELAVQVIREILSLYPHVKGLQVMNDQGRYMFEGTRGQWLLDTPDRRDQILKRMRNWRPFSQSNPVPGMIEAVRTFWASDKRISAYVIGDEFTGDSIQDALDQVAKLNKPDENGRRVMRIHAIGYMNARDYPPFTNVRFFRPHAPDLQREQRSVRRAARVDPLSASPWCRFGACEASISVRGRHCCRRCSDSPSSP